jgi:hypothetical protein
LRRAEAEVKDGKDGEAESPGRKYCKAYHLGELRRYPAWAENKLEAEGGSKEAAGEQNGEPQGLADDDVVFLHQDYTVTKSIWPGEGVVFDNVTDQWKAFCDTELRLAVPDSLDLIAKPAEAARDSA